MTHKTLIIRFLETQSQKVLEKVVFFLDNAAFHPLELRTKDGAIVVTPFTQPVDQNL